MSLRFQGQILRTRSSSCERRFYQLLIVSLMVPLIQVPRDHQNNVAASVFDLDLGKVVHSGLSRIGEGPPGGCT